MAGNTKMNENERGVMTLNGLIGGLIATLLLVSCFVVLTWGAIVVQQDNAENFYEINQDLHALKSGSYFSADDQSDGTKNHTMWINK